PDQYPIELIAVRRVGLCWFDRDRATWGGAASEPVNGYLWRRQGRQRHSRADGIDLVRKSDGRCAAVAVCKFDCLPERQSLAVQRRTGVWISFGVYDQRRDFRNETSKHVSCVCIEFPDLPFEVHLDRGVTESRARSVGLACRDRK